MLNTKPLLDSFATFCFTLESQTGGKKNPKPAFQNIWRKKQRLHNLHDISQRTPWEMHVSTLYPNHKRQDGFVMVGKWTVGDNGQLRDFIVTAAKTFSVTLIISCSWLLSKHISSLHKYLFILVANHVWYFSIRRLHELSLSTARIHSAGRRHSLHLNHRTYTKDAKPWCPRLYSNIQ